MFYFRETRHFREKRGGAQQVVHVGEICFFGRTKEKHALHLACELVDRGEVDVR